MLGCFISVSAHEGHCGRRRGPRVHQATSSGVWRPEAVDPGSPLRVHPYTDLKSQRGAHGNARIAFLEQLERAEAAARDSFIMFVHQTGQAAARCRSGTALAEPADATRTWRGAGRCAGGTRGGDVHPKSSVDGACYVADRAALSPRRGRHSSLPDSDRNGDWPTLGKGTGSTTVMPRPAGKITLGVKATGLSISSVSVWTS